MAHRTYPRAVQLADVLEVIADAIPDEMGLITNEVAYTYAQLDERATRLANHLTSLGIRRGEHVGIHAQNCHEWVESFYACCKIGAVPVNVNYRYVAEELAYLFSTLELRALVHGAAFEGEVLKALKQAPTVALRVRVGADGAPGSTGSSASTHVSLLPPPCDEFTTSEPFLSATRVSPPGST